MPFGNSERFNPQEARKFMEDLTIHMTNRAHHLAQDEATDLEHKEEGESVQQQLYGDRWKLLYGIVQGIEHMKAGSELIRDGGDWQNPEMHWEIDDSEWQEHYDEYGYGKYGRGLKIGKRLAFYSDHDFSFSVETDDKPPDTESAETASNGGEFTFTDYSDE